MLTDDQFRRWHQPESIWNYVGFGFVPTQSHHAIGAVEYTRLGGTRYYIQKGTYTQQVWQEVNYEQYFEHCKAI